LNIIIVGKMGTGKVTLAKKIVSALSGATTFIDGAVNDDRLQRADFWAKTQGETNKHLIATCSESIGGDYVDIAIYIRPGALAKTIGTILGKED
jgi:adenylate kinase family enzyme